jgi:hypothetical protein
VSTGVDFVAVAAWAGAVAGKPAIVVTSTNPVTRKE